MTFYLNGCVQYGIKPPVDKEGKLEDTYYIDDVQLMWVDEGVSQKISEPATVTGGAMHKGLPK